MKIYKPTMNNNEDNEASQSGEDGEEAWLQLNPEDVEEVIELDTDNMEPEDIARVIEEVGLEGNDNEAEMEGFEPLRDDATAVFTMHTGSVFCVSLDPSSNSMAVTGGEDDTAYVWKVANGSLLLHLKGHKDSVTCAAFSCDSQLVATSDMSGLVKVWKVDSGEEVWSFEVSDMEWLEWHPVAPVLFAGTVDGHIWMWKIPGGDCKTFLSHGSPCNIAKVMPDGKRTCAGYGDGLIKLWDLKGGTTLHTVTGHLAHTGSITSMSCHHDNILVLTGSTDATAKLINTNNAKVVATFDCNASGSNEVKNEDSVETVGFSPVQSLAATGTLSGSLVIWDVPSQAARHTCRHEAGIVRLQWAPEQPLLYTGTLDGIVHQWDARTGREEATWYGHRGGILDLDVSRDGSILVTASDDKTARVFSLS